MKELFKNLKKMATSFLAICLIISMLPIQVFAETTTTDENITVAVSVGNNTFFEDQGNGEPAFTGELFDTKVEVPKGSTAFDAFEAALKKEEVEYSGSSGYISGINGLNEFDGGSTSGWMVTVNDWFINVGVGSQTVEDNDKITFMYSCNMGEDLGGTWSNNDKTIKSLKTDVGTLSPEFSSDVKKYELKVPAGTTGVVITPTATNKNFQVRASVDGVEYKRIQTIPVKDKTVISVKCGDPSWPSMNNQAGGAASEVPAETYEITVVEEKEEATEPVEEGNEGETIDTLPDDFANDLWLQYEFKELKSGDTVTIYPRRVPQIVDNPINNNVTRPEFNFEIIKGDSITLDTTKTTDKATVTALKEGTSIVKVTYDAVGTNGASSIVNTAYVVYDVIGDTDTGITIDSNIKLTSYDTIYYTEGKSTDYTINPTIEGADKVEVTCNGKSIEKTDDGYVLPLENRSNIIGIIASNDKGTKKYYKVIDARKIEISIVNASREGKPLRAGDTAKISFKGITHPVYKLATIYNPTWLQESWGNKGTFVEYTNETLGTVKGYCTQWDLATKNTITVKFDKEGSYKFTSGRIFTQWWGSELGADKGEEGKGDPNLSAPQNEGYFSSMPDFTIDVKESLVQEGNEGETIDTLPDDFANDLWLQYDFKELKSGDTATIYPRRVPQIVDNPINNNVTRPEFNFEIIKGDSITLDTTKTTDKATVTAVKEGTSIVKVTYDAVGTNGASSIVNTAYVVYDVVGDTDTGITIDSNIKLTSYDTIYYTEGKSIDYTINPTIEGADEVAVTCNGKVVAKTDDGYVLPLENRSNIIGIIAANDKGIKKYYKVIDARKIEISIVNASREGEELQAGDTAKISFKGITHPVYKLATIYNPTWVDPSWGNKGSFVEYTNETLGTVKGYCRQWDLATNNTITVKFDKEGSYKFTSGKIFTQWWGSELGADKGEEGKGDPNLSAPQNEGYFSSMPDFTIDVKEKDPAVTFDADNGTDNIVKSVKKGESLDFTPEAPNKEGYTFVGWYTDTNDITTEYKNNSTYTEDVTYKAKWAHVEMLGAQGKLVVDGKSGIRFGTKIYNDGDEIVEKGTLIIPASLLDEGEALTLDNKSAAKSIGKVSYEVNEEENYVTYLGTLVNIPESKFDTEITAAAYVIYKDKAGNEYTVYSQYPNGSISVYKILGNNVDWDNQW